MTGEQKITFGEMRAAGVRNVLIYCTDYACGHHITVPDDADRWSDNLRISEIEDKGGHQAGLADRRGFPRTETPVTRSAQPVQARMAPLSNCAHLSPVPILAKEQPDAQSRDRFLASANHVVFRDAVASVEAASRKHTGHLHGPACTPQAEGN